MAVLLPAEATRGLSARGDTDGDGDDDALIVLQNSGGDVSKFKPRKLIVLRRNSAGYLEKAVESADAILCQRCGGMMGDPLQQIRVGHGEFTLRFEGGSRELWSSEFKFEYFRGQGVWKLTEIFFADTDRLEGTSKEQRKGPADFGEVSLQEFDAAYLSDASP